MNTVNERTIFSYGRALKRVVRTPDLAPAVSWFAETKAREVLIRPQQSPKVKTGRLPALMCGDRDLSPRGVERVHFKLHLAPGFYRFDFGFLALVRRRIADGDNCRYPLPSTAWRGKNFFPYDGRMKAENARTYYREHDLQLDAPAPEAAQGFQEIDEMDHQPEYARIEFLLDRQLFGHFQLSTPIFVEAEQHLFTPHLYSRGFAIEEDRDCVLTVQAVNRPGPGDPAVQSLSIITEDFCPTLFRLSATARPRAYNAFLAPLAGASTVDLWGWEYCVSYMRTDRREVDLDYLTAMAKEAHIWGSNLAEVYWTSYTAKCGHVIEWPADDQLKGRELYHRPPDTAWNNEKLRALNRRCHDLGMVVVWYQHLPLLQWSTKPYRDRWSPPDWWRKNFVELICREFADVLKAGWRGALDCYEEESGGGSNSIQAITQTPIQWRYHPGMAQCETHRLAEHRHVRGLVPGAVWAPTNSHFVWDNFHEACYPFEPEASVFGKQHLFLQSNCRTRACPYVERTFGLQTGTPSLAGPDAILQQANDFFRPRLRGTGPMVRSGIWWLTPVEEVMPPEDRDYVYGISNDPVRAAAAGELTATGTGGVLDGITSFYPNWCHPRHQQPAGTGFIGNNHLRLYLNRDNDGGELMCDIEGLADYTRLGPAISLARDPFRTVLMEGPTEYRWRGTVGRRIVEPAGCLAVLTQHIEQTYDYLGITITENRRYELVADSPYVTLTISRHSGKETKPAGHARGAVEVNLTLNIPGYDVIDGTLRACGVFAEKICRRPRIVLRDSRGIKPDLFILLVAHSPKKVAVRFSPDHQLRLVTRRRYKERWVIRFGALTSWLHERHLPNLHRMDGFAATAALRAGGGTIKNPLPLPVIRPVRIRRSAPSPWLIRERGWWTWQGAKPSREFPGTDYLRVYIDGGKEVKAKPEGFLQDCVMPGWGSQYQVSIGERIAASEESVNLECWVRSVSALLFAPRLQFRQRVAAATLDGELWLYFDDTVVYLPNREGKYRLAVSFGTPEAPHLVASFGVPAMFSTGEKRLSVEFGLPPYSYRLPKSVYLHGAVRTLGKEIESVAGATVVRRIPEGAVLAFKPGVVVVEFL